jgi:ribosomal protein S18 acetylase RimI-like enzyme
MSAIITPERPDTADAVVLITELEAQLEPFYPSASRHGLSVERLLSEAVAFFVLRSQGTPAGCGGVKLFDGYGELKRMYLREQFRGQGFAQMMLDHLAGYTRAQGITTLRLETGIHQHAAIRMYQRAGFQRIGPFGPYTDDPLSLYFEKRVA